MFSSGSRADAHGESTGSQLGLLFAVFGENVGIKTPRVPEGKYLLVFPGAFSDAFKPAATVVPPEMTKQMIILLSGTF